MCSNTYAGFKSRPNEAANESVLVVGGKCICVWRVVCGFAGAKALSQNTADLSSWNGWSWGCAPDPLPILRGNDSKSMVYVVEGERRGGCGDGKASGASGRAYCIRVLRG